MYVDIVLVALLWSFSHAPLGYYRLCAHLQLVRAYQKAFGLLLDNSWFNAHVDSRVRKAIDRERVNTQIMQHRAKYRQSERSAAVPQESSFAPYASKRKVPAGFSGKFYPVQHV